MKITKIPTLSLMLSLVLITSCLKDPGTPMVSADKTTVSVNEEVMMSLTGIDSYTCLEWRTTIGGPEYTIVDGGNGKENIKVKFTTTGMSEWTAAVKNCSDGCSGRCKDVYGYITITVQ
jgi:hypothetical protein